MELFQPILGEESPPSPLSLVVVYAVDSVGLVAGVSQVSFPLPAQAESGVDKRQLLAPDW